MKSLSLVSLIIAGLCFVLALAAHFFFDGRIVFNWDKYISGVIIFLLASIAFALHHLIVLKNK